MKFINIKIDAIYVNVYNVTKKTDDIRRHGSIWGYRRNENDGNVIRSAPKNTGKNKNNIWRQFIILRRKKYTFDRETSVPELALILKNWVVNTSNQNG